MWYPVWLRALSVWPSARPKSKENSGFVMGLSQAEVREVDTLVMTGERETVEEKMMEKTEKTERDSEMAGAKEVLTL